MMPGQPRKAGSSDWTPPKTFDEYRVLWTLGRGGMGEVYLGHDMLLDRAVAIKFISSIEPDALAREQFLTEARAAARIQHPNVLTVYRVGEIDGRPFIISEYVRGQNLERTKRPMPWQRALDLGIGLARGLAAAHRRGVLHRDIKPGTVPGEGGGAANDPQPSQRWQYRGPLRHLPTASGSLARRDKNSQLKNMFEGQNLRRG